MRLHRIRVQDFRGVADREVVLADRGITVVEGPNEAGKTSLADAVDLLLRRHDSSTARDVKDAVPVGRDVGPLVEVEMSTGPYRFTYAKRWMRGRMTELTISEPSRRHLTGREAHDEVERILHETLDAPLWSALRVAQGDAAGPVDVHTATLARVLDGSVGSHGDEGAVDDDLEAGIALEWSRHWSPTGRPRGERVDVRDRLEALDGRIAALHGTLDGLESDARRMEGLSVERHQLDEARGVALTALTAAEERWAAVEAARRLVDAAVRHHERALSALSNAEADRHRRHEVVDDREAARAEVDKLEAEIARTSRSVDDAAARAADAAAAVATVVAELGGAMGRCARLEAARDRTLAEARRDELAASLAAADAAEARLDAARVALDRLPEVADHDLAALEEATTRLVAAEARLDGAITRVVATTEGPLEVEVDGTTRRLDRDAPAAWDVTADLRLSIPGTVSLTISPAASAATLAAAVDDAREDLDRRCAALGVESLSQARAVRDERRSLERAADDAAGSMARAVGGRTPDERRAELVRLDARLDACADAPRRTGEAPAEVGDADGPDGEIPAGLDALDTALASERERVAGLSTRRDDLAADERHHRAQVEARRLEDRALLGRIEQAQAHLARIAVRLDQAREVRSDDELDRLVVDAAEVEARAGLAATVAHADLDALAPDEVGAELAQRRDAVAEIERSRTDIAAETARVAARLDAVGESGVASELDAALAEHEQLSRRLQVLERRAGAVRRLHQTMAAHQGAARRRYAAPFRAEVERLGRVVFGADLQVELDDDLAISRRILDGVALDLDQLSLGAREQLGLLARLACASIVSGDGGAPVVFDDVLGHADPDRLRAMGRALELAAADGAQVIVLTCSPERYADLDVAARVSLA